MVYKHLIDIIRRKRLHRCPLEIPTNYDLILLNKTINLCCYFLINSIQITKPMFSATILFCWQDCLLVIGIYSEGPASDHINIRFLAFPLSFSKF